MRIELRSQCLQPSSPNKSFDHGHGFYFEIFLANTSKWLPCFHSWIQDYVCTLLDHWHSWRHKWYRLSLCFLFTYQATYFSYSWGRGYHLPSSFLTSRTLCSVWLLPITLHFRYESSELRLWAAGIKQPEAVKVGFVWLVSCCRRYRLIYLAIFRFDYVLVDNECGGRRVSTYLLGCLRYLSVVQHEILWDRLVTGRWWWNIFHHILDDRLVHLFYRGMLTRNKAEVDSHRSCCFVQVVGNNLNNSLKLINLFRDAFIIQYMNDFPCSLFAQLTLLDTIITHPSWKYG